MVTEVDGYRILDRLGSGGQGVVHLAEDSAGRVVALKLLRPETLAEPGARERLAAEVAVARRVPSFCTARLLGARVDGDQPYLVTEYVKGPNLATAVEERGPFTGSDLERLMVATLTALVTIHQAGVVHHDLKPANIILGPDGPRVVDFGIALRAGAVDPQADADGVLGSAAYLAPERLDAGPATPASDLFGWAATMVHAATGASPFHAPTQAATIHAVEHAPARLDGVPAPLRPLLAACLDKDPARRPSASAALASLLRSLQPGVTSAPPATGGIPVWGTPPPPPVPVPPPPPRSGSGGAPSAPGAPVPYPRPPRPTGAARPPRPGVRLRPGPPPPASPGRRGAPWPVAALLGLVTVVPGACIAVGLASPDAPSTPYRGPSSPVVVEPVEAQAASFDSVAHRIGGVELIDPRAGVVVVHPVDLWGRSSAPGPRTTPATSPDGSRQVRFRPADAPGDHVDRFTPDGSWVASLTVPVTTGAPRAVRPVVRLYDASSGRGAGGPWTMPEVRVIGTQQYRADAVAASRYGTVVAAAAGGAPSGPDTPGRVTAWRKDGTDAVLDLEVPDLRGGLVVSPDGGWVAFRVRGSGTADHYRLVQVPTGSTTDLPSECLGRIAFDLAGTRIYCQTVGSVRVLDLTGARISAVPGTASVPGLLVTSPDGRRLAQVDGRRRVVVVDLDTGRTTRHDVLAGRPVTALAFDLTSRRLIVAGAPVFVVVDVR